LGIVLSILGRLPVNSSVGHQPDLIILPIIQQILFMSVRIGVIGQTVKTSASQIPVFPTPAHARIWVRG
jgi:hypothetical protein